MKAAVFGLEGEVGVALADRLSVAGIGPDESRFADAVRRVNPALLVQAT